jgi:5-bromo-4-chloroindolyl phosphate hydrolysis protein
MVKIDGKTDIALIKSDISYIKDDIGEIKSAIKGLSSMFASKEELKDVAKDTERRLSCLERSYENIIVGPKRYVIPILTAIGTSVVTFLIIQYLEYQRL